MGGVAVLLFVILYTLISTSFGSSVYSVKYNDTRNNTCVYVKMDVSFTVNYQSIDKAGIAVFLVKKQDTVDIDNSTTCIALPPANKTHISGSCYSNTTSSRRTTEPAISIYFGMKFQHMFKMIFNITDTQWVLSKLCLNYSTGDTQYFMNASNESFYACHSDLFSVAKDHDYYCQYGQSFAINSSVTASFSFIEVYPLGSSQGKHHYCPSDKDHEHAKTVPIVVGSVLGLLLLLIFVVYSIAYLRQRGSITRSYEPLNNN